MNEELRKKLQEAILNCLSTQRFVNWHSDDGNFGKWITDEEANGISKEQILAEIDQMFLKNV